MVAAASKGYLKKYGAPNHPKDLINHKYIITNNGIWHFNEGGKEFTVKVKGRWKSNNARASIEACKQDIGIIYLPKSSFLKTLENKELFPLLQNFSSTGSSAWIIYPNREYLPLRIRHTIDFLLKHFESWEE